jgi:hypothetical protein
MEWLLVNFSVPFRMTSVSIALAILLLLGNLRQLRWTVSLDLSFIGHDEVTLHEKRFASVRELLPSHGIVGYIDDNSGQTVARFKEYFLTQYTVAPVVLIDPNFSGTDSEILKREDVLIISNLHHSVPDHRIFTDRYTTLLKDFGNGLQLYRSERK